MKNFFVSLILIYLLLMLLLYVLQRKLLYYPTTAPVQSNHDSMVLEAGEVTLKVVIDNPDAKPAILYFGGNAENVWWSAGQYRQLFDGYAVYYLNYPGYGGSSGAPTEESLITSGIALYSFVKERHDNVFIMGRSLGTGVAMAVASQGELAGLILVSPYDSIANVAAAHYPMFPTHWLVKDKFDSVSRVEKVRADVLLLVASEDQVVPPKHSQNLLKKFIQYSQSLDASDRDVLKINFHTFEGYHHNNIDSHPEFASRINTFLAEKNSQERSF